MNKLFDLNYAQTLDAQDSIAHMRHEFHIPKTDTGKDEIYFCGNSLGLQPKRVAKYVNEELEKWQQLGVKGHFETEHPWMPYHEFLRQQSAEIVGAEPDEVVCMNTLTVNLHLMMVSFYRPTSTRHKILIEAHAFPSDHYAVSSQIKFHGFDPDESMLLAETRKNEECLRSEDILELIGNNKDSIAMILLPGVQYYTGQVLDIEKITAQAKKHGITIGWDLAHAAGNVPLSLHDWDVDFAAWCNYKYLNSGPGSVGSCFIHKRHHLNTELPRFNGWWGHDKKTRFLMNNQFEAAGNADAWQLSNPPILSLAAIRASLDTISEAGGMQALRNKSVKLTGYLRELLQTQLADQVTIITPDDIAEQGSQLSLCLSGNAKAAHKHLEASGVTGDWREPNVIRIAPTALYNSYEDCYHFVAILKQQLEKQ